MCNGARNNLTDYVKKCVRIWDKNCQDFSHKSTQLFISCSFCVSSDVRVFGRNVKTLLIKEIAIMHPELKHGTTIKDYRAI